MKTKVGVDIVELKEFTELMRKGGETFLSKCFRSEEIGSGKSDHLAGVFAAKEAVMKALSLQAGSWLDIRIGKKTDGRPFVELIVDISGLVSYDLSISHSGNYAVAVFVVLIR